MGACCAGNELQSPVSIEYSTSHGNSVKTHRYVNQLVTTRDVQITVLDESVDSELVSESTAVPVQPTFIEFKWNKDFKDIYECDTLHMFYLLQCACELQQQRVIEHREYNESVPKSLQALSHVNTLQIITNFIEWHNMDREKNVFTGELLKAKKENATITDMISKIGNVNEESATQIVTILGEEQMIQHHWTEMDSPKLKLFTLGMTKMYKEEVGLEECTVEDIVTLFEYTAATVHEQTRVNDEVPVNQLVDGIFAQIERENSRVTTRLTQIDRWKEIVVESIREQEIDGKTMKETATKELSKMMRIKLEPNEKESMKLNGSCGKMIYICKRMPVDKVLEAAKAITERAESNGNLIKCVLNDDAKAAEKYLHYAAFRDMIRDDGCTQNSHCPVVQRIVQCLNYRACLMNGVDTDESLQKAFEIFTEFCDENYGKNDMICDYAHFMDHHSDIESVREIAGQLQFRCIGVDECRSAERHFRRQETKTLTHNKIENEATNLYIETTDTLHFYLCHLEETGLRNPKNTKFVLSGKELEFGDDRALPTSMSLTQIRHTVREALTRCIYVETLDADACRELQHFVVGHDVDTDCMQDDAAIFEEEGSCNLSKALQHKHRVVKPVFTVLRRNRLCNNTFVFGYPLFYWKWYRTATKETVMQSYLLSRMDFGGYTVQDLCVRSRFGSIKEEALESGLIGAAEFERGVVKKAARYLKQKKCRRMQSNPFRGDGGDDPLHFGIKNGTPLLPRHLHALFLYTDYTDFCTEFSESTRKVTWDEELESLKKRNSFYFETSKSLREIVTYFGSDGRTQRRGGESGPFWTGVNCVLSWRKFSIAFNIPTSATKTKEIAVRFAGERGMIIVFDNKRGDSVKQPFFNAKPLSAFPEEDERLWYGSCFELSVESIVIVESAKNYRLSAGSMYLFDAAISGQKLGRSDISSDEGDALIGLLESVRGKGTEWKSSKYLDQFAVDNFYTFCLTKTKLLFSPSHMKGANASFVELIYYGISDDVLYPKERTNLFRSDVIELFSNLVEVEIWADEFPLNLLSLLSLLNELKIPRSFQSLKIRDWRQDWLREAFVGIPDIREQFAGSGWDIHFETVYFVDWVRIEWRKKIVEYNPSQLDTYSAGHFDNEQTQMPEFERIAKPHPGDYFKDQFPDKIDVRGEPTFIEFKWNKDFKNMDQCDTIHMLYLLQCACELHRKRTIERNKYFMSIARADRYLSHVDTAQIITNFIKWHDKDKEKNVFTGELMKTKKKLFIINEMISGIGQIKKGPATRIFTKLRKEVVIRYDEWTETGNTKLRLETWGLTKMYEGETVLEECTVEQIVTLFEYRAPDVEEKKEDDQIAVKELVDGVFAQIERVTAKRTVKMRQIEGWKEKIVHWLRDQEIDGKKLKETANKELNKTMRITLEPDEKAAKLWNGPCGKMLNVCKKMPVHKVLEAAKARAMRQKLSDSVSSQNNDDVATFDGNGSDDQIDYNPVIWDDVGMVDGVNYLKCKHCNKLIVNKRELIDIHLSMEDHRRNMGELIIDVD